MSEGTPRVDEAVASGAVHPQPPTPIETEPKRSRSNFARRLLTAAIVIPPIVYVIVAGGFWSLATVIVIILLGLYEFYQLIAEKGAQPLVGYGLAAGAALPVVAYLGNEYHATVLMTAVLLAVMVAQLAKAQIADALASISGTFFGVFYVGWLLSHAIVLREFHGVVGAKWGEGATAGLHPEVGIFLMLFTVCTVVACDAGAYFAGRAYGKRKLAPKISPKKTVEGAIGGVLFATLIGMATKGLFDLAWPALSASFSWRAVLVFAPILAVVAIVGDLVQSLLKRDARAKDTGRLLPGMGGVLDRIDSSLLAIPVMYYLLLAHTYLRMVG